MKLPEWNKILTFIVICSMLMIAVVTSAVLKQDENSIDSSEIDGQKTEKYVPSEIIVKFKPGLSDKDVSNINSGYETSVLYTSPYAGFKTLKVPKTKTVEEMAEIYSKNPNVEYAVPNYVMYATMEPNDPYYTGELNNQWNFKGDNGINVEQAWDISIGRDVVVAVLDTGVADNSPDLDYTNFI
jgi:serine protease